MGKLTVGQSTNATELRKIYEEYYGQRDCLSLLKDDKLNLNTSKGGNTMGENEQNKFYGKESIKLIKEENYNNQDKTVNILGIEYNVMLDVARKDDKFLDELDGYTDNSSRVIVVCNCDDGNYDNLQFYKDRVLLHELIHSFLNECGLPKCTCEWHCEEMVEWVATQSARILKAYEEVKNGGTAK